MSPDASDESPRLLRGLALSTRFHLYLVRCTSPRAADAFVTRLADELPGMRGSPVRVVRLEPYAGRAHSAPLSTAELDGAVLLPLLDAPPGNRHHGIVHLVDASRAPSSDEEVWGQLFSRWNEKRNVLQTLGGEVVVLLSDGLVPVFATAAPDVWSIRSGEYQVTESGGSPSRTARPRTSLGAFPWRALPPLSLFGGDILVAPWIAEYFPAEETADLLRESRSGDEGAIESQRTVRRGEEVLFARRFADAEQLFRIALDSEWTDNHAEIRARRGLGVSLVGQDRSGEAELVLGQARELAEALDPELASSARGAEALAAWCLGRLSLADADRMFATKRFGEAWIDSPSRKLLATEQGEFEEAWRHGRSREHETFPGSWGRLLSSGKWHTLHKDASEPELLLCTANLELVAEDRSVSWRDGALAALGALPLDAGSHSPGRTPTLQILALHSLARGDAVRAAALLRDVVPATRAFAERRSRVNALHAYALAVLALESGDPGGALGYFEACLQSVESVRETALDRRALLRARTAALLGIATTRPRSPEALEAARGAAQAAESLLGDCGLDLVARVLAVAAIAELGAQLRVGAEAEATLQRAVTLAKPLLDTQAPPWVELAQRTAYRADAARTGVLE